MKGERTEWQRTKEERVARTKTHSRRKMIGQMRSGTSFRNVNVELRKKMAVQMQLHLGHVHFDECVLSGIRVRFDVFWKKNTDTLKRPRIAAVLNNEGFSGEFPYGMFDLPDSRADRFWSSMAALP
jgi:hypothetical protein